MFERYTDPAKRALFFARYEASEFGSLAIEPEHLLLGLLREPSEMVRKLLSAPPASVDVILAETRRRMHAREKISTSVEIPFSRPAQVALVYAAEEADRLLHKEIKPTHLLLGLLREEGTVAASVLQANGVQLDAARQQIVALAEEPPSAIEWVQHLLEQLLPLMVQLAETKDPAQRQAIRAHIDALLDQL